MEIIAYLDNLWMTFYSWYCSGGKAGQNLVFLSNANFETDCWEEVLCRQTADSKFMSVANPSTNTFSLPEILNGYEQFMCVIRISNPKHYEEDHEAQRRTCENIMYINL